MRSCIVGIVLLAAPGGLLGNPPGEPVAGRVARLIEQLGHDQFAKREEASKELDAIGEPALAALRKAGASRDDPEIRRRAEKIAGDIAARLLAPLARKEIEALQGTWHSASTEAAGVRQSGENKVDRHFFAGDQWKYEDGGSVLQAATIKIVEVGDTLVKIDFIVTDGYRKGDTWVGVYERHGDELTWCGGYVGEGRTRPATLTTRPGDGYFLRSLKREKK
jgi:uncharacterized protein (TIGR03067 family)